MISTRGQDLNILWGTRCPLCLPWIIEVDHILGDHLVVDCSLQSVREQADDVLLDLIL